MQTHVDNCNVNLIDILALMIAASVIPAGAYWFTATVTGTFNGTSYLLVSPHVQPVSVPLCPLRHM